MNRDLICRKIFYDVYPANKNLKLCSLPALIVCNTDSSSRPGEHWIVLYVDESYIGEYFDSVGRFVLDVNCTDWIWNEKQSQSVFSKLCGHYCIFYCLYRGRGVNVRKVAKMFTKDTSLNDSIVHNFVFKFERFYCSINDKNLYNCVW